MRWITEKQPLYKTILLHLFGTKYYEHVYPKCATWILYDGDMYLYKIEVQK